MVETSKTLIDPARLRKEQPSAYKPCPFFHGESALPRFNVNAMSFSELAALRDQINRALSSRIDTERSELQKRLAALDEIGGAPDGGIRRRGRPPGSTGNRRGAKPGTRVKPKYRGPNGELWSGRGNAPRWLASLEKAGKKRESYLIAK